MDVVLAHCLEVLSAHLSKDALTLILYCTKTEDLLKMNLYAAPLHVFDLEASLYMYIHYLNVKLIRHL